MTQDEIIEMAREAGFFVKDNDAYSPSVQEDHELTPYLVAFANLVAAKALREHAMREVQRLGQEIEQEHVALEVVYETIIQWDEDGGKRSRRELARRIVALYTTPPQRTWVGMTNEEIDSYFEDQGWSPSKDYYPVIKAIEAKLKQLNT